MNLGKKARWLIWLPTALTYLTLPLAVLLGVVLNVPVPGFFWGLCPALTVLAGLLTLGYLAEQEEKARAAKRPMVDKDVHDQALLLLKDVIGKLPAAELGYMLAQDEEPAADSDEDS